MSRIAWALEASPDFESDYRKLCTKNASFRAAVDKKVQQILVQPLHYKPLRAPLHGVRRAHVGGSFCFSSSPMPDASSCGCCASRTTTRPTERETTTRIRVGLPRWRAVWLHCHQ
ncbi:MAG: type II toxin-antitoxin system RelE family toxin [Thermoplasmatota archaeon]